MKTITFNGTVYTCPFQDLLRPLTPEERDALKKDIQKRGIVVPVIEDEDHGILDGINRLENWAWTRRTCRSSPARG